MIDDVKAAVVITNHGVSVNYLTRESIHTNLIPEKLFQGKQKLEWRDIVKIVRTLEKTGLEGRLYSKEEMEEQYRLFKEAIEGE